MATALASSLLEDMRTAWVPDYLGAADALAELAAGRIPSPDFAALEEVPIRTTKGPGSGWVAPPTTSLYLTSLFETELQSGERHLEPSVCGYRDSATPYRQEFKRYRQLLVDLSKEFPYAVTSDIKDCFGSIHRDLIAKVITGREEHCKVLEQIEHKTGQCLLSGFRWARRLVNVVLRIVDIRLKAPFVRWQDDYSLFAATEKDAFAALHLLEDAVHQAGLSINWAKTRVTSSSAIRFPVFADEDARDLYLRGRETCDVRALKFALTRLGQDSDPLVVDDIHCVVTQMPVLAPRAAAYLSAIRAIHPYVVDRTVRDLSVADDTWTRVRFLAVAVRHRLPLPVPGELARQEAIRGLELRHSPDALAEHAPLRLRRWVAARGLDDNAVPIVATTL